MERLDAITPHFLIEIAKIRVHNTEDQFARDPIRLLMRRLMTFATGYTDAANAAKESVRIRPNDGRTTLDIFRCEVALSATQTTELMKDVDPGFFEVDALHETPTQQKEKVMELMTRDHEVVCRAQAKVGWARAV